MRPPGWRNPRPRDPYHLLVIGAGPAGLVAARGAAALGATVALIESHLLGGDCLNYGCIPSKPLIRTARVYADMRNAANYGACVPGDIRVDFAAVMERMRRIRARISRVDSAARLSAEGIDVFFGTARFTGGDAVEVEGTRLRFKKALIATGSRPMLPSIPGLAEAGYLTNETVFDLTALPASLLVIGGGPLGCELAQAFWPASARAWSSSTTSRCSCRRRNATRRRWFPMRWRATASRSISTPPPSACASKAARSSSRRSTTGTSRPSRSTRY